MAKLFSYVVDHDYGYAPNPEKGLCTLAKCKYGTKKRNIVEIAQVGDWLAGTGGADPKKSAGHGKLVYAMRVDDKTTLGDFCRSNDRIDATYDIPVKGRSALLSGHFFYFGRNAIKISEIPTEHLDYEFEKTGPGYRCDFSEEFVEDFANWLQDNFKTGVHGGRGKRVRSRFGRLGKSFFPRLVFWLLTRMALSQRIYGIFAIAATAA